MWGGMKKPTRKYIEHHMQKKYVEWARDPLVLRIYPSLAPLHSIPNGGARPRVKNRQGKWWCPEGKRLKEEGLLAGMPDLCLPVSRGYWLTMYIEMKAPGESLSKDQKRIITLLLEEGHHVVVADDVAFAKQETIIYLNQKRNELMEVKCPV
jgi:hypothetical protein